MNKKFINKSAVFLFAAMFIVVAAHASLFADAKYTTQHKIVSRFKIISSWWNGVQLIPRAEAMLPVDGGGGGGGGGTVINGACAATHYNCTAGTSGSNAVVTGGWTWQCLGSGGGTTASCSEYPPVNGVCASTAYNCTAGTSANNGGTADTQTWNCTGLYGGTTASCSVYYAPWLGLSEDYTSVAYGAVDPTNITTTHTSSCTIYVNGSPWYTQASFTSWRAQWGPLYSNTVFLLKCTGLDGSTPSQSVSVTVAPLNGDCGPVLSCPQPSAVQLYSGGYCQSYTPFNCYAGASTNNVTGTTDTWTCAGANGGTNAYCSRAMPINAVCAATHYNCATGYPYYGKVNAESGTVDLTPPTIWDTSTQWIWQCIGPNQGTSVSCSENKPVDGVCAATAYNCSVGTSVNNTFNGTSGVYSWNCNGLYGGANPACSQTLPPVVSVTPHSANGGTTGYAYAGEAATLTWTASYAPSSCNIYQNGSLYTSVGGTVTSWTTPGLPEGSTTYRVDCINSGGTGTGNTVTYSVPTSPSNLSANCPSPGSTANFSWTLPGAYTSAYFRYYNSPPTSPDYNSACNPVKTPPNGACTVVNGSSVSQATTPGTPYYFYIHSRDSYGNWSNAVGSGPFNCSINGVCAAALNTCSAGTFTDIADDANYYYWYCAGIAGGANSGTCSSLKPPVTPLISAAASPINYNTGTTITWSSSNATACAVTKAGSAWQSGTSGSAVATGNLTATTVFSITCSNAAGTSPANSVTVTVNPLNGVCNNATNNACSAGTLNDTADTGTLYQWQCVGANGGTTASCSLTKPVPNAPAIGGTTTPIISTSYPYTFSAADPTFGQTVAYNIDWDNNGTVDQTSAYGASGWVFTQNNNWASAGAKTFKAYTSSSDGRNSGWTTYNVTVPTPVNGVCTGTHYTCSAGTSINNVAGASQWTWDCAGINGGTTQTGCFQNFPINGVCDNSSMYACTAGVSVNNISGASQWTWDCNGQYGGTNATGCSKTKPLPNTPTISGTTTGAINTSYTYTFTATDPLSSTVRYNIDWDNNGTVDQSSAYGASGWTFSQPNSWAGSGVKTFQAYTETSDGRTSAWVPYNVTIVPASTASISAAATPIAYNTATTITWSSTNATSCTITKNGSAWQSGLSGTAVATGALTANATFAISCTGTGGNSSNSVIVYVNPSVTLSAASTSIAYNAASAITWSSANASSCTITANGSLWQSTLSGTSVTTGALTANTTYLLTCTGPGSTTANTSVVITVAPLNGSCGATPTHYTCPVGTSVSNVNGPLQWTWVCNGANGGTNANCSETKPPPSPPTITGPTQGQVSTSYTFSFQAANTTGDGIRYAIDWDNNGTVDQYLPASGTTTPNTLLSTVNNWGGSGTKTFEARTETNGGPVSTWTSYTISIYGIPTVTWSPGAATSIPYNGTVSFGYTSTDAVSCSYYDLNPSTGAIQSTIWSNGATSSSWTNAGPYQADFRRRVVCQNPFSQTGSAEIYVTVLQNKAACGTITVPSYVAPGATFSGTITMTNPAGSNPWRMVGNSPTPHRLGAQNPQDNNVWGLSRVELPADVAAGGTGTFTATFTAPTTEGDYTFAWQMLEETLQWFGPICQPTTANGNVIRVKAPLLAVLPANYGFPDQVAGDPAKTMLLHVTNLGGGNILGGNITGFSGPFSCTGGATNCNFTLGPGETKDISISFMPMATGTYSTTLSVNATSQASVPVLTYGNGVEKLVVSTDPVATVSVDPLDFGDAATTRSRYLNFTLKNMSLTQDGGAGVVVTPTAPFTCVSNCTFNLPAGSSQVIRLKFTPTVVGTSTGTVSFSTTPPTVVNLTGVGVKPAFTTNER